MREMIPIYEVIAASLGTIFAGKFLRDHGHETAGWWLVVLGFAVFGLFFMGRRRTILLAIGAGVLVCAVGTVFQHQAWAIPGGLLFSWAGICFAYALGARPGSVTRSGWLGDQ